MALVNFKNEVLIRVYVVTIFVVIAAALIFGKAVKLVTTEGAYWRSKTQKAYVEARAIPGERGNILADDGALLATSIPYFDVYWDANSAMLNKSIADEFGKGIDTLSYFLSTYIDERYTAGAWKDFLWQHATVHKGKYVPIAQNLTKEKLNLLKTFPVFRHSRYKSGLIVSQDNKREHPFKMLCLRTLGYVKDGAKPVGLEGYFDKTLSGGKEKVIMQNLGGDIWVPVEDIADIAPRQGEDLHTTIDVNIQDITQTALIRSLDAHQAEYGTAIVMEVATGKIKAIANVGKTDEGWWEVMNYGVGVAVEPGSIWKIASMMALLEDGHVRLSDTVDIENGRKTYFNEVMEDHERTNKRVVSVKEAFAVSSNVGISKLVVNSYAQKPIDYIQRIRSFNLDLPTGVEIEGEGKPYIKDPSKTDDRWSGTTLPWMSIGYELSITPLQYLSFVNAIANNGALMKPYLVQDVKHFGETVKTFKPTIVKKRIASESTLQQTRELMEAVVESGTAAHLRTPQYRFAGKTGTAQLEYKKKGNKNQIGGYQASFVGYFPAEKPVYSCIVVINKPKNGYYGGLSAAPVFREIADRLMASSVALSMPLGERGKPVMSAAQMPDDAGFKADLVKSLAAFKLKFEMKTKDDDWVALRASNDTVFVQARAMSNKKIVPSVMGMGLKDALYLLENRGLGVRRSGYGKVVAQSVPAGTALEGIREISLRLE
jgi:cell division protein FtsI (penicillin-binding protein 3)